MPIQGDQAIEPDELFSVTLSAPTGGAVLGTAAANGTIQNDDMAPPVLAIAATDAAKIEGQSGTTPFTFTVSRSGDASPAISARWTVVAGSAVAADFVGGRLPSGTVSLAANQTSDLIFGKGIVGGLENNLPPAAGSGRRNLPGGRQPPGRVSAPPSRPAQRLPAPGP